MAACRIEIGIEIGTGGVCVLLLSQRLGIVVSAAFGWTIPARIFARRVTVNPVPHLRPGRPIFTPESTSELSSVRCSDGRFLLWNRRSEHAIPRRFLLRNHPRNRLPRRDLRAEFCCANGGSGGVCGSGLEWNGR